MAEHVKPVSMPEVKNLDDPDKPSERQPNGLLIERSFNGDGWGVTLHTVGDMRRTEVLSVLKLALAQAKRELSPSG